MPNCHHRKSSSPAHKYGESKKDAEVENTFRKASDVPNKKKDREKKITGTHAMARRLNRYLFAILISKQINRAWIPTRMESDSKKQSVKLRILSDIKSVDAGKRWVDTAIMLRSCGICQEKIKTGIAV